MKAIQKRTRLIRFICAESLLSDDASFLTVNLACLLHSIVTITLGEWRKQRGTTEPTNFNCRRIKRDKKEQKGGKKFSFPRGPEETSGWSCTTRLPRRNLLVLTSDKQSSELIQFVRVLHSSFFVFCALQCPTSRVIYPWLNPSQWSIWSGLSSASPSCVYWAWWESSFAVADDRWPARTKDLSNRTAGEFLHLKIFSPLVMLFP